MSAPTASTNRTLGILKHAQDNAYGVIAHVCYDLPSILGLVQAATELKSPAIVQLFPITLENCGPSILAAALKARDSASVPIAVHLDHATDPAHLELVLKFAREDNLLFDSVMVDCSHAETDEENMQLTRPWVEKFNALGVAVEVELGRMEGGEAGLRVLTDGKLTKPEKAIEYMEGCGAQILSPSIGNLHGEYLRPPDFRQDIVKEIRSRFGSSQPPRYQCLHGTDQVPDSLFHECIRNGISKINTNKFPRTAYVESLQKNLPTKSLPEAIEEATKAVSESCKTLIKVFGSEGKA